MDSAMSGSAPVHYWARLAKEDMRLPPRVEKPPPAYTLLPETMRTLTVLLASGPQPLAVPVMLSRAARRLHAVAPFIVVKLPPTYTLLPETARALTVPLALGFQSPTVPLARIWAS